MKKTNAARTLDRLKIPYELIEYAYDEADLSVPQIAIVNNLPVESIYKTLVAKGNKTGVVVAVIRGDKVLNFKALAAATKNKKVALVPVKEIQQTTGYIRGGCSPLGMKKDFSVFLDELMEGEAIIYVNAGIKGVFFKINAADLQRATKGTLCPISLDA